MKEIRVANIKSDKKREDTKNGSYLFLSSEEEKIVAAGERQYMKGKGASWRKVRREGEISKK